MTNKDLGNETQEAVVVSGLLRYVIKDPFAIQKLGLRDYPTKRFPDGVNEVNTHYIGHERWTIQIAHENFTILESQKRGYQLSSSIDDFASYNVTNREDQKTILRFLHDSDSLSRHV